MWKDISSARFDCDLQLAVIERGTPHELVFPCRRTPEGWENAENGRLVDVSPTHWREWEQTMTLSRS
ncbi:hypothetical protein SAMN05428963_101116 [Consotaella salsifontis]|uniref:Uncharacterized protein n=1 Tax=Consotaella salsifontis TaxID=1365950 RepID=A0A1T4L9I9_9HYPH|nr:hypothetical protein SAMN05428963_101116 [Consotaella salsifontis]